MSGIRGERLIGEDGNVILTGGLKCAETNRQRYGKDWYAKIGAIGGRKGTADGVIKGFAANPTLAREAGAKGGRISKRGPAKNKSTKKPIKVVHKVEEPPKKKRRWPWSK